MRVISVVILLLLSGVVETVSESDSPPLHEIELVSPQPDAIYVGDKLDLRISGLARYLEWSDKPNDELRKLIDIQVFQELESPKGKPKGKTDPDPNSGIKKTLLELGFRVVSMQKINGDTMRLFLSPMISGDLVLPSLVFSLKTPEDPTGAITESIATPLFLTASSSFKVLQSAGGMPSDAIGPLQLKFPWWLVTIIAFFAVIIWGLIIYYLMKVSVKAKIPEMRIVKLKRDPHVIALEALGALENKKSWEKGDFKSHYFGVSEILKAYFGGRYNFDAAESTTTELLESLRERAVHESSLGGSIVNKVKELFGDLDFVKFTELTPEDQGPKKIIDVSRSLINSTKKLPPPKPVVVGQTGMGVTTKNKSGKESDKNAI